MNEIENKHIAIVLIDIYTYEIFKLSISLIEKLLYF